MIARPNPPMRPDDRPQTGLDGKQFNLARAVTSCVLGGLFLIVVGVVDFAATGLSKATLGAFALGVLALAVGAGQIVRYRYGRRRDAQKP